MTMWFVLTEKIELHSDVVRGGYTTRGETLLSGAPSTCPECETKATLTVLGKKHTTFDNRRFAVGSTCNCGVYTVETAEFRSKEEAELAYRRLHLVIR